MLVTELFYSNSFTSPLLQFCLVETNLDYNLSPRKGKYIKGVLAESCKTTAVSTYLFLSLFITNN